MQKATIIILLHFSRVDIVHTICVLYGAVDSCDLVPLFYILRAKGEDTTVALHGGHTFSNQAYSVWPYFPILLLIALPFVLTRAGQRH